MKNDPKEILKQKRLGEILKSLDFIDDEELKKVLEKHKNSDMKIGEVLSSMGFADREVILSIVGKQMGHPYIKVSEYGNIPGEILRYVPEVTARNNMMIPFDRETDRLKVAMSDPQSEEVRAALSILSGLEVEAYLTSEDEILTAINKNY
ncbi:MAG: hypothetical protein PF545_05145 [Elusimicrobia bacterium]|jgi:hypothetical protein|nr:hypothetical protein [Elusimicrobiota bacterium]